MRVSAAGSSAFSPKKANMCVFLKNQVSERGDGGLELRTKKQGNKKKNDGRRANV